jgi:hypothetical protein
VRRKGRRRVTPARIRAYYKPTVPPELHSLEHRIPALAAQANQADDQRPASHAELLGRQLAAQAVAD